ncbi:U84 [Human betaherpesvirus 6A]|uniref:Protein U84 n=1 Tax=Human herpesvirus 6A (strain Uganda-1102) TaxID=10370 RepID=VU84_HHV6U|nr:U84 [Human betaherpesvirus 6A]P52532.1 RecName: Full=Protein U84 [Human herpesvirus 6 (strain Uganda-1102)]AAA68475.1 putative glycoprotein [Human betaherpesvirus 6A]CAA58333.1 U84 [Human betaherpesvirus 6A]
MKDRGNKNTSKTRQTVKSRRTRKTTKQFVERKKNLSAKTTIRNNRLQNNLSPQTTPTEKPVDYATARVFPQHTPYDIKFNKEKYRNNEIYAYSKLRKISNAVFRQEKEINRLTVFTDKPLADLSFKMPVNTSTTEKKEIVRSTECQRQDRNTVNAFKIFQSYETSPPYSPCSPKNFMSEIYRLFRCYNASIVQIQVYSRNKILINAMQEKLMSIGNMVINVGEQIISESVHHEPVVAIAINQFFRGTVPQTDALRKNAVTPIPVNASKKKLVGICSLMINAPTEKDLLCAAHVCINFAICYPNEITLNIAKLTQPMLLQEHITIYNSFNKYIYWDDYGKLLN